MFRFILLGLSLFVSVGIAEGVVRAFFPIYGGVDNIDKDGQPVREWFKPGSVYRQFSNEYDATTTITSKGHRVPGSDGNPDVVFIGDSFTFGFGLADDETFASRYCAEMHVTCANLGIPGSGTVKQMVRLEQFLVDYHWKPREVKWFFFGMSGSFASGNDFVDNYNFGYRQDAKSPDGPVVSRPAPTLAGRLIGLQTLLLDNSYLMRQVKFRWGPLMKSLLVDPPGETRLTEALRYTQEDFRQVDELSRRYGFDYKIYLIVPVQDLIRGTYNETLKTLNSVITKSAIPTAPALADQPQKYYYAYDGHLNAAGSRKVAELLIAQDQH